MFSCPTLGAETHIVVVHIARFKTKGDKPSQLVPEILRYMLGSSEIIKTGLEVLQDGNLCETQLGVQVHGLRCLGVLHDAINGRKIKGVGGLSALCLGKYMNGKGDMSRQLNDWSLSHPLTEEQIDYVANDALISLPIHNAILQQQILETNQPQLSPVWGRDMKSSSPALWPPTPIFASLRFLKAKIVRERKHRENFESLDSESRILYENLLALRNSLMRKAGLWANTQTRFAADTDSIFSLAKGKPVAIEALRK